MSANLVCPLIHPAPTRASAPPPTFDHLFSNAQGRLLQPAMQYLNITCPQLQQLLLGTLLCTTALPASRRAAEAIGPFGIPPRLHTLIWDDYLAHQPDLASKVRGLASQHCFLTDPHAELGYNLGYAMAIAWLIYQRQHMLPKPDNDLASLARIWEASYPHRGGRARDYQRAWREAQRSAAAN